MSKYARKPTFKKTINFRFENKENIQYIYENVLFVHNQNEAINFAVWFCAECIKKGILPYESEQ